MGWDGRNGRYGRHGHGNVKRKRKSVKDYVIFPRVGGNRSNCDHADSFVAFFFFVPIIKVDCSFFNGRFFFYEKSSWKDKKRSDSRSRRSYSSVCPVCDLKRE